MKIQNVFGALFRGGRRESNAEAQRVKYAIADEFSVEYYTQRYPDISTNNIDGLDHFVMHGWREGRDPVDWFSTSDYLAANPDVAASEINPFFHYVRYGRAEGRAIVPARTKQTTTVDSKAVIEAIRDYFDERYYRAHYPDMASGAIDPLEHYAIFGWREGRDPAAWFSTRGYLDIHADVRAIDVNPLYHYALYGRRENRRIVAARFPAEIPYDPDAAPVDNKGLLDIIRYPQRESLDATKSFDPTYLDIHVVIPDFSTGGGGHMTIFRIVRFLEIFGHRCTVWINGDAMHPGGRDAYDDIVKEYQAIAADVRVLSDDLFKIDADAMVATDWQTVWPVTHCSSIKEKFYFVQDYEPLFHAMGSQYVAAELTYARDLACICASQWLEGLMKNKYGRWARYFELAYDHETYRVLRDREARSTPRIAAYCRVSTPRRLVELLMLALTILARRNVDFHVDMFGSTDMTRALPFSATNHGVLDELALAQLYNDADVGVCFSATNYSLAPQEMMACGLPVVEFDGESTHAVFPPGVVTYAGPDPAAMADAIQQLIEDPERRAAQSAKARAWVEQFSWERSARKVEAALIDRLTERGWEREATHEAQSAGAFTILQPVKASVIIPTYNGGEEFKAVVERVLAQRAPWKFELVVIDSSSTDGTAEFCRSRDDLVFEQIPQKEFNHGATRNRAIEMCRGEYVAVLTQDALPTDEYWLYNFIILMDRYPRAAGAFGRHLAYPGASPFVARDIDLHFAQFRRQPLAVSKDTNATAWRNGDVGWRQFLFYYSDNNSCLRRNVWKRIPYPPAAYGEDQMWARSIIEAGYEKLYSPRSIVYHSHDYDSEEMFERAAIEARFFRDEFDVRVLNEDPEAMAAALNVADAIWAADRGVNPQLVEERKALNQARILGYKYGLMD